jgi:hypothetical protein
VAAEDRVAALIPADLWDDEGNQYSAEVRLTLDDDTPDVPVKVDFRLIGGPGEVGDWILNVELPALERALMVIKLEREAAPRGE